MQALILPHVYRSAIEPYGAVEGIADGDDRGSWSQHDERGSEITPAELIRHARSPIAGYPVAKAVGLRDEPLPLSGALEVLEPELRAAYWKGRSRSIR